MNMTSSEKDWPIPFRIGMMQRVWDEGEGAGDREILCALSFFLRDRAELPVVVQPLQGSVRRQRQARRQQRRPPRRQARHHCGLR